MLSPDLPRRALAEGLGTALLVATVVGSGIAAQRLFPDSDGLALLANTIATGAVLVALILALGPVSAAFNPVVTLVERLLGALTTADAAVLTVVQVAGACLGAVVANVMFTLPAVNLSARDRSAPELLLSEAVATFGLVLVILGVARSGRPAQVAYAVAGYITAAYWFTPSTSFANPAVTLGRTLSDTFAGIAPASAPLFILAQVVGGLLALAAGVALYPQARALAGGLTGDLHPTADHPADDEVPA